MRMTINRLNYEIYLVDYLDGKLSAAQVEGLMLFLDQNPDIKEEFEGMEDTVLVAESAIYPNKSSLKKKSFLKDGIDNEFDYLCISATEGLLSKEEKDVFEREILKDPLKHKAYRDFQKTKFFPKTAILYPSKEHLKRASIVPIRYSYLRLSISVAATISLLLGVYTIGKLVMKESSIENAPFRAETIGRSSQTKTSIEIKQPVAIFTNHIIRKTQQKTIPTLANDTKIQVKQTPIDREEYIPNPIKRKKLPRIETQIDPQPEELAQIINKLYPERQIIVESLVAQQNGSDFFETIQFGLKSFGRLIGRDIKLDANKDENGNIEKISFESKFIAFSTQVKND